MERTPSIVVRAYRETDFDALVRLTMESSLFRTIQDPSYESIIRSAMHQEFIDSGDEQFSIIRTWDDAYCGNISLKPDVSGTFEIGISITDHLQNQGIGTEALRQFCDYCFRERGIQNLLVRIQPQNTRSIHVFEKLGAVYMKKQALPILQQTYALLGKPLPHNLDEISGVLHYELRLPLTELKTELPE